MSDDSYDQIRSILTEAMDQIADIDPWCDNDDWFQLFSLRTSFDNLTAAQPDRDQLQRLEFVAQSIATSVLRAWEVPTEESPPPLHAVVGAIIDCMRLPDQAASEFALKAVQYVARHDCDEDFVSEIMPLVVACLRHDDEAVKIAAFVAVIDLGGFREQDLPVLVEMLDNADRSSVVAAGFLFRMDVKSRAKAEAVLRHALDSNDHDRISFAIAGIAESAELGIDFVPALTKHVVSCCAVLRIGETHFEEPDEDFGDQRRVFVPDFEQFFDYRTMSSIQDTVDEQRIARGRGRMSHCVEYHDCEHAAEAAEAIARITGDASLATLIGGKEPALLATFEG